MPKITKGIVRPGYHLLWPDAWGRRGAEHYRGGPGTVVDISHPVKRRWLEGQFRKIEEYDGPEPEAPIMNGTALAELVEYEAKFKDEEPT